MTGIRLKSLLAVSASALTLAACGSAEVASPGEGVFPPNNGGGGGVVNPPPAPGTPATDCPSNAFSNVGLTPDGTLRICQLPQQITGNLTLPLRAGTIYSINGRTAVGTDQGVDPTNPIAGSVQGVLTIEAGVRIMAEAGATYLLVNRGSQLFAEGTATNPIVFTSRPNIEGATTLDSEGQWGGVVLAGRAPQSSCNQVGGVLTTPVTCGKTIEGTAANYGGNVPSDNSGRLRYVQIKYSGFVVGNNNELQGLTLGGVGNGTTIDHIQVYNSSDDGIEIFGGTVNLRHIVINGADDDGLDTDEGWRGGAQFGIVTQRPANTGSRSAGFEFSSFPGSEALATRYVSRPFISNWTLVGRNATSNAHTVAHFDTGNDATVINSVFTNVAGSAAACLDIADADTFTSMTTLAPGQTGPNFRSVYMSCGTSYRAANAANSATVFTAGTNNTAAGGSTLTAPAGTTLTNQVLTFINGANETIAPANVTNAPAVYSFFTPVTYIGAVQNTSDTWWQGWTCGLTADRAC
ncbi:MAG: hypothetical protein KKG14_06625 [Alphaproteobacteria bacterium]|nr:hypothetical protein [Alphaproteobacteria bacterium]MBU2270101.1 hypothetical protein [Alphaproteobacteria bacterium]MBU2418357.1 hypothetical protein [Alphaproteobacteria bacterium]